MCLRAVSYSPSPSDQIEANEHLHPRSPLLVIVLTNQIPETAIVDLWSFVERFSKKLETYKPSSLQGQSAKNGIPAVSDLESHHRARGNCPWVFWDPLLHIKLGFAANPLFARGRGSTATKTAEK